MKKATDSVAFRKKLTKLFFIRHQIKTTSIKKNFLRQKLLSQRIKRIFWNIHFSKYRENIFQRKEGGLIFSILCKNSSWKTSVELSFIDFLPQKSEL